MRGATDRRGQRQLPDVISIRAPHAGSDSAMISDIHRGIKFQSALPLRGATAGKACNGTPPSNFNPRSPCGERQLGACCGLVREISIRAPLAGSDTSGTQRLSFGRFQSALPLRGATKVYISSTTLVNFNPRSPCGERPPCRPCTSSRLRYFNPRSPCGERRDEQRQRKSKVDISIRAPLAGSDALPFSMIRAL